VGDKFDGGYLGYQPWFDKFSSFCHRDDTYSKIEKFQYLLESVTGDAASAISMIPPTEVNYDMAVQTLKDRFGRRIPRISAHVNELLKLPEGPSIGKDSRSLRSLVDTLRVHIRCLESMGVLNKESDEKSAILGPIILSRLPSSLATRWYEANEADTIDLTQLLDFTEKKVQAMELSSACGPAPRKSTPTPTPKQSVGSSSRSTMMTAKGSTGGSNRLCPFDQKNHHPAKCPEWRELSPSAALNAIRRSGRCLRCFGLRHSAKECNFQPKCTKCEKEHMYIVCPDREIGKGAKVNSVSRSETRPKSKQFKVLMQTATASVQTSGSKEVPVRILIDSGSECTFIEESVAQSLKLPVLGKESLTVSTFGGGSRTSAVRVYHVTLQTSTNPPKRISFEAYGTKSISGKSPNSVTLDELAVYQHLKGLQFADVSVNGTATRVSLLLGSDVFDRVFTSDANKTGKVGEPYATNSIFGWILSGPVASPQPSAVRTVNLISCGTDEECETSLSDYFKLESYGVEEDLAVPEVDSDPAVLHYRAHVKHVGDRYEVALPWKQEKPPLENNLRQAQKRFHQLLNRLDRQPHVGELYNSAMDTMQKLGFVEPAPSPPSGPTEFYLPHHPVIKATSKTTKCRPVFAGNATDVNGVSLNDCLLTGPSLIPNLPDLLLRFRFCLYVVSSDITKAFLQLGLDELDRDACRFLWMDEDGRVKVYRFKVVTFGIVSSPFLLNMTILHHLSFNPPPGTGPGLVSDELLSHMRNGFYVDNLFLPFNRLEDIVPDCKEAHRIMLAAGMDLSQWVCNAPGTMAGLSEQGLVVDTDTEVKILGMLWNVTDDFMRVRSIDIEDFFPSKRSVLVLVASVYDPCGLLSLVTVRGKLILQSLWIRNLSWDQEIQDGSLLTEINAIRKEFASLSDVKIPRPVMTVGYLSFKLIVFCDASLVASVANVYLRQETSDGSVHVALMASKVKTTPKSDLLKPTMTIPRAELVACLIGSRLGAKVHKALGLPSPCLTFFTDSTAALGWIRKQSPPADVFIRNRVLKILSLTTVESWRHVPGDENPSDLATRPGRSVRNIPTMWFSGPPWLQEGPEAWPDLILSGPEVQERPTTVNVATVQPKPDQLVDLQRFSSLARATRVCAKVLHFVNLIRKKIHRPELTMTPEDFLLVQEQRYWFEDYRSMQETGCVSPKSTLLPLGPRWDSTRSLIVSVGRDDPTPLPLVPKQSRLAELLLIQAHQQVFHAGPEHMLAKSRELNWIVHGRTIAKRIKRNCTICRYLKLKPYFSNESALPKNRTQLGEPFHIVGLDFAGPFYVLPQAKTYVLLVTCALTRAVHLELLPSMSAPDFSLGFRKFEARRGPCKIVYSDNAKTFLLFRKLRPDLQWNFLPDRSPWWGGFYERLVRSFKECLRPMVGSKLLRFAELEVLLIEIEGVLNSRPLCRVSDDPADGPPLTPKSFLSPSLQDFNPEIKYSTSAGALRVLYRHRKRALRIFWDRWSRTYLRSLRQWRRKLNPDRPLLPSIGDIVVVHQDHNNRFKWPRGRIESMIMGRDGVVRAAYVRLPKGSLIRRAVRHLYPLELIDSVPVDDPADPPELLPDEAEDAPLPEEVDAAPNPGTQEPADPVVPRRTESKVPGEPVHPAASGDAGLPTSRQEDIPEDRNPGTLPENLDPNPTDVSLSVPSPSLSSTTPPIPPLQQRPQRKRQLPGHMKDFLLK
jgi:hypothetical protein